MVKEGARLQLLALGQDCIEAIFLQLNAPAYAALRATCRHLCLCARERHAGWMAAHHHEYLGWLEACRLSSHYSSLDSEELEIECESPRYPPPPWPVAAAQPTLATGTPATPAVAATAAASSSSTVGALDGGGGSPREVWSFNGEAPSARGKHRARGSRPEAVAAATLAAQAAYFAEVEAWSLEVDDDD
jgi:hypothetical protein